MATTAISHVGQAWRCPLTTRHSIVFGFISFPPALKHALHPQRDLYDLKTAGPTLHFNGRLTDCVNPNVMGPVRPLYDPYDLCEYFLTRINSLTTTTTALLL